MKLGQKLVIERSKITTAKISGINSTAPSGVLPGLFSIAEDRKVRFSKGNLWTDDSSVLHFEDKQYGFNNKYELSHVSHFTWAESVEKASGETGSSSYLFCDKDHKVSVYGSSNNALSIRLVMNVE